MTHNPRLYPALILIASLSFSGAVQAWTPGPGGTMRVTLDRRASDPRAPGNGDFLDCSEPGGACSAVLIPRIEPDEKVSSPRNKRKDDLRYLSLKGFRARGGDPLGTAALYPGKGGGDSIFFDDNNDEDLGNDGPGRFWPKGDSCVTVEPRSVAAPFSLCRAGGKAKEWRARCEELKTQITWAYCEQGPYRLKVLDIAYGTLHGLKDRKIGMADLDADGRFHLQAGDRLLVDWNGDGVLEKSLDGDGLASSEKDASFTLDSASYEVAAADENGGWIDLRRTAYNPAAAIFKAVEGRTAPDLRFVNLDGDTVRLSDFHGKKVLVNFWSVLCKPCIDQFPAIAQFNAQFASKNWQVISLTTDKELDLVQQASMKYHLDWMVGMVGPEARAYYTNRPLPLNVKIDAQGLIEKKDVPLGRRPF
jgi:thiol-disulfide isomerase/thioredoxin